MRNYSVVLLLSTFFTIILNSCGFFPRGGLDLVPSSPPAEDEKSVNDPSSHSKGLDGGKKADILFVADTSYPMAKHLEQVDKTFKNFVENLSPLSWRLAFTNADYDSNSFSYYGRDLFVGRIMHLELNGKILPHTFLYSSSKYRKELFIDTLKRYKEGDIPHLSSKGYINPCDLPPYCQGSIRSPIRSLINSLFVNSNLVRKDASAFIAILFTNGDDIYVPDNIVNFFVNKFREQYGSQKTVKIYSISITPGNKDCLDREISNNYLSDSIAYGETIHKLVQATGGKSMSICSNDYSPLASMITYSLLNVTVANSQ